MSGYNDITDIRKGTIVKELASKSYKDVGIEYGLDKIWPNSHTMKRNITRMIQQVRTDPELYGVSTDAMQMVEKSLEDRKKGTGSYASKREVLKKETQEMILEKDIKSLSISGRDKSAMLLHKKMDILNLHPKQLEKESIVNLAKVFATFFDKAQIATGQATEHIAVLAKMDDNISPEMAIEMLLKVREANIADKDKTKTE